MSDEPQANTSQSTSLISKITLAIVIINFIGSGVGWFLYDRHKNAEELRLIKFKADIAKISTETLSMKNEVDISTNLIEMIENIAPNITFSNKPKFTYDKNKTTISISLKNIGKSFVKVSLLQFDLSESKSLAINTKTFNENALIKLDQITGYSRQNDITDFMYPKAPIKEKLMDESEFTCRSSNTLIGPGANTNFIIYITINEPTSTHYSYRLSLALRGSPTRLKFFVNILEEKPTLQNQMIRLSATVSNLNGMFFTNN